MDSRRTRWGSRGRAGSPPVKIGFIGAGNIGTTLIAALLQKKIFKPNEIGATTAHPESREKLARQYRIPTFASNLELAQSASILLLSVKPQQMRQVLEEIREKAPPLVMTIAAGLDTDFYYRHLGSKVRLIRLMPNTPAKIGKGVTGLFVTPKATEEDEKLATQIFSAVGKVVRVAKEEWLDIVTALSGGGPAFVYLFVQALLTAGELLGLPPEMARNLVLPTLVGAVELVEKSVEPIESLITKVASKRGTTEAGLSVLKEKGFAEIVIEAIRTATRRAKELRDEMGES